MRDEMTEILLAVAAANAEHEVRRRNDPMLNFTRRERVGAVASLTLLLAVLALVSLLGSSLRSTPAIETAQRVAPAHITLGPAAP